MADRLRIVLEFKKTDIKDIELYSDLLRFSNPSSIIKDILKGLVPVSVIKFEED